MTIESIARKLVECGIFTPADFTVPGPFQGAVASAVFSGAITGGYVINATFKTLTGCSYTYSFPLSSPVGFTLQLGTQDLSDIVQICWCAQQI